MDFTQFLVQDWGWYYLSIVFDDYSHYILAYRLSPTMNASDIEETLKLAFSWAEIEQVKVYYHPRLLSDNGPAYHSKDLAAFLTQWRMEQIHDALYHPTTQSKIECWQRLMKSVVKLQNYYTPSNLRQAITSWVNYYNNKRFHESLNNVTPADVYFSRRKEIQKERNELKKMTLALCRKWYYQLASKCIIMARDGSFHLQTCFGVQFYFNQYN